MLPPDGRELSLGVLTLRGITESLIKELRHGNVMSM